MGGIYKLKIIRKQNTFKDIIYNTRSIPCGGEHLCYNRMIYKNKKFYDIEFDTNSCRKINLWF